MGIRARSWHESTVSKRNPGAIGGASRTDVACAEQLFFHVFICLMRLQAQLSLSLFVKCRAGSKIASVRKLWSCQSDVNRIWFGFTPHPVPATTRIITVLVGNPSKPSFATLTGWG